jgi:hypothetical protein
VELQLDDRLDRFQIGWAIVERGVRADRAR